MFLGVLESVYKVCDGINWLDFTFDIFFARFFLATSAQIIRMMISAFDFYLIIEKKVWSIKSAEHFQPQVAQWKTFTFRHPERSTNNSINNLGSLRKGKVSASTEMTNRKSVHPHSKCWQKLHRNGRNPFLQNGRSVKSWSAPITWIVIKSLKSLMAHKWGKG